MGQWAKTFWSFVRPILARGAREAAAQLLDSGGRIISDFARPEARDRAMDTVQARAKEGWAAFKEKVPKIIQNGEGRRRSRQRTAAGRATRKKSIKKKSIKKKKKPARRIRNQCGRGLRTVNKPSSSRRRASAAAKPSDIFD